jgi:DNA-binding CsgD family transcriptional regulator
MMDEVNRISNLIGDIYDAALDPALWPSVLEKTCGYVEGVSSTLVSQNPVTNSGECYFSWGLDPEAIRLYNEKYIRLNPAILSSILTSQVGDVESTETLVPYHEFVATRFYREWAEPRGFCDSIWTILEKSATAAAGVSILRDRRQGLADDAARRRLGLLSPHFRRAVAIGKVIDLHKVEAAALADTLDGLATAMVLVDAGGRVVHANTAAHAMLAEGSPIRLAGGKLVAIDAAANQALHDVVMNADGGNMTVGVKGIAVPLSAHDGERHVAHVLPLTSGARRKAGVAYSAVAAVFVRKAALDLPHPLEAIARTFKLTPAEMRVLMMIIEVGGVPEVVSALGVSGPTVKTHLQHVFQKTGTSRQADLVKLVAGYMSPLRG